MYMVEQSIGNQILIPGSKDNIRTCDMMHYNAGYRENWTVTV